MIKFITLLVIGMIIVGCNKPQPPPPLAPVPVPEPVAPVKIVPKRIPHQQIIPPIPPTIIPAPTAPIVVPEPLDPTITRDEIKSVQRRLARERLYTGEINGEWGPTTSAALSQYQQNFNLDVTGKLDLETRHFFSITDP